MKRIIIRVMWVSFDKHWWVVGYGKDEIRSSKAEAVYLARMFALDIATTGGRSQVVSHRKDGVIQWERTYPRSSDPRRSRG